MTFTRPLGNRAHWAIFGSLAASAFRSRAAFVTMTVFASLLLAPAVKVLLVDAFGDAGVRQLIADVPVLLAVGALFRFALMGARRAARAHAVA